MKQIIIKLEQDVDAALALQGFPFRNGQDFSPELPEVATVLLDLGDAAELSPAQIQYLDCNNAVRTYFAG